MDYLSYLVVFPAAAALVAAIVPSDRWRPWVLPLGSAMHLALVVHALSAPAISPEWNNWLVLDPVGKVFLLAISVLHLMCMLYAPGYLALRHERPNRVLCVCMLFSLAMMSLVVLSHHLGLMWVAVEATTLASAPSLYFNNNVRSLEATWKYLLICSVGIALALLGSLFLAYSALHAGLAPTLLFDELLAPEMARGLSRPWLHAAFILLLVGYGTKMGLSPMHTWKPDAYGEAPGIVGALLAGAVTSSVFLAIVRVYQIAVAGGEGEFASKTMIFMGLLSMATAAVFMVRQRDFKRLLAYSSVEHMGILAFGLGIGGSLALFGTLLHVINNAMTKGVLFLSAGNIHRAYGSKLTNDVAGAMRALPLSGSLFFFGFLAGSGSPPFGPFASEFSIVSGAFAQGHYLAAGFFLVALLAVFIGMGATVLSVVLGEPSRPGEKSPFPDGLYTAAPIAALMVIVVWLGVRLPPFLTTLLDQAVRSLAPLS
jgi:hydrogenase-4 component F